MNKNPYRHIFSTTFDTSLIPGNRYPTWCGKRTNWTIDNRPYCPECVKTLLKAYNENAKIINEITDQIVKFQGTITPQN
jgi:hypothetical protein